MKLTQKNFDQFLENQKQVAKTQEIFAEALNHRMTRIEIDVSWIKKAVIAGLSGTSTILIAIFIAVITKGI